MLTFSFAKIHLLSAIKKLAGQTAVYGLSSVVGRLLNYLLTPLLTNFFLPAEYGINTEIYAYISFFNVVFTYGMETAFFRFSKSEVEKDKVFSTINISILFSSVLFCALLLLASPLINAKLHYETHKEIMWCMCAILFFDTIAIIPFNKLRLDNKPMQFAGLKFLGICINIMLVLFFIKISPKLSGWLAYKPSIGISYVMIANVVASISTSLFVMPALLKMKWQFDWELYKKLLPYALPLLIVGLGGMINETFDRILLNFLLPDELTRKAQIGIYGACYKISLIITMFVQAFRMAGEPFFFNHAEKSDSREIYAKVMQIFVAACLLIVLGTMLFIDYVKYFIGADYRVGLQVVPILLIANVCIGIYYNLTIWYKLTNQTMMGTYITLGGAAVTLAMNFILIPTIGFMGSAWATLVCYFLMMCASYFLGQKYFPVNYPLRKIFTQTALALGIYAASQVLTKSVFFQFGIFEAHSIPGTISLAVLFVAAIFLFWKLNKRELHL
ncbi:MAG: hypothetical protein RL708_748 [Bacteroidota bacterium]